MGRGGEGGWEVENKGGGISFFKFLWGSEGGILTAGS